MELKSCQVGPQVVDSGDVFHLVGGGGVTTSHLKIILVTCQLSQKERTRKDF
jgi:hypothetical protein